MKQDRSIKTLHTIMNFESKKWKERQSKMLQKRESATLNRVTTNSIDDKRSMSVMPPTTTNKVINQTSGPQSGFETT
jgi:hypothetical protein